MLTTIQLDVDQDCQDKIVAHAARRGISAAQFVLAAIRHRLESETETEWREGFEAMGRDPDTNNID
jgi:post-segregation antitoxin (ccd killing protein)